MTVRKEASLACGKERRMQSRAAALRLLVASSSRPHGRNLQRSWTRAAATTNTTTAAGAGDPSVHSEDPQGDDADEAAKAAAAEQRQRERHVREGGGRETPNPSAATSTARPKSPLTTSPKLESSEVPPRVDPAFQQKRQPCSSEVPALEDVSCVGWDGKPLGGEGEDEDGRWVEQQIEDYREYFQHHKPTPLSGLEFADTRRPIRRATDSDVTDDDAGVGLEWRGWNPEQLDTVDEALLRAEAMFREAAERGDPETPHGRVLANYQRLVMH